MPEIAQIVELAVRKLEDLGATVELVETPFPDPTPAAMTMFAAGIVHSQRHLDDAAMAILDPDLRAVIENSASVDREAYMSAVDQQLAMTRTNRHRKSTRPNYSH